MGQSSSNHEAIAIYIQTNKPFYIAGQYLEGIIYLTFTKQYGLSQKYLRKKKLQLLFKCNQKVFWSEGSSETTVPLRNNAVTYQEKIVIYEFEQQQTQLQKLNSIKQKQKQINKNCKSIITYKFPFKFLLPQSLAGSLIEDQYNEIKYNLVAQIIGQQTKQIQTHNHKKISIHDKMIRSLPIKITIIQPFRSQLCPIQEKTITLIKCCKICNFCEGICQSYGSLEIILNCDRNYISPGKFINVKIQINNQQSLVSAKRIKVFLVKNKLRFVNSRQIRNQKWSTLLLHQFNKKIFPGYKKKFEFTKLIPKGFSSESTSIGKIIAVYFTLKVIVEMESIFISNPQCQLHLVYQATNQMVFKNPTLNALKQLNSIDNEENQIRVFPQLIFNNLGPYKYAPEHSLSYHNRNNCSQSFLSQRCQNLSKMAQMSQRSVLKHNLIDGNKNRKK